MVTPVKSRFLLPSVVMARSLTCGLVCILVFGLGSPLAAQAAPKTDVIHLKNGDRLTGEIKSLFRGKLELSTDHMDTVLIEWDQIQEIESNTSQSIELTNGTRFFGPLDKPESENAVRIDTAEGAVSVDTLDVIAMYPVEAGFWQRLDLSVNFGFSWDKSSQVGKYSFGMDAMWRDPRFITRGSFVSETTTQDGQDDSQRTLLTANHMRFMGNKHFRAVFGNLEQNHELGIDLRSLVGAGYGILPIRSQRTLLGLMAGLAVNREVPSEGESEANVELVGSALYDYFFYSHPERRINVEFNVYPSLTDGGRYRANLDTSFIVELFKDLYWDLSIYGSYDNEPLSADGSKSDYGFTSSLGYSF